MGRKGKAVPSICASSGLDESLLLLKWKESNVNNLPPSAIGWFCPCSSLLLADWLFDGGNSKIGLGR